MYRKELLILASVSSAIFLFVAGAGWLTIEDLRGSSTILVKDTLPGLINAGVATERMRENRALMHDLLITRNADKRAQLMQQIQTNRTDAIWRNYGARIHDARDRQNFQAMMSAREEYLAGCERFTDMVSAGKIDDASAFFYGELFVLFGRYNQAAEALFSYNVGHGIEQGNKILKAAQYAPLVVATFTVLMFLFGLTLGMRFVLSGAGKPEKSSVPVSAYQRPVAV